MLAYIFNSFLYGRQSSDRKMKFNKYRNTKSAKHDQCVGTIYINYDTVIINIAISVEFDI